MEKRSSLRITLTVSKNFLNLSNGYVFTEEDEPLTKDKFTKIAHSLVEGAARTLDRDKIILP